MIRRLGLLFVITAPGCAPVPLPTPAAGVPAGCPWEPHHFIFLDTDTTIYRQGATIRLTPRYDKAPAGTGEIPEQCTSRWTLAGPARLARDHGSLTIDGDAPVGAEVVIGYRFGTETASARFRVIGRDEIVLTGTRGQRSIEGCDRLSPVRELVFAPGNRFSITFTPFETYKDYWGSYRFDPASGALSLSVEGGNNIPPGLDLEGRAQLDAGGRLILDGFYLGSQQMPPYPIGNCRYTF